MSDNDSGSTGPAPTSGTTATTPPGEETNGTQTQTGTSTTTGPTTSVDTTMGSSSGSESGSSSGSMTPCQDDDDCTNSQTCNVRSGICESLCEGDVWGAGNYDYCLNEWGDFDVAGTCAGPSGSVCIYGDFPVRGAVCSDQGCKSICDCPEPPATGNATVTCSDITFGDSDPDCYLSCAQGETCPDGMMCQSDLYCAHMPPPLSMYGNCENVDAGPVNGGCAAGQCRTYQGDAYALCVATCNNQGECDAAPPGSAMASDCNDVAMPPSGEECYIPCNNNNDCPFDMECVNGLACMWPII